MMRCHAFQCPKLLNPEMMTNIWMGHHIFFCAANNHSTSIMTVIKTAHTQTHTWANTNFHLNIRIRIWVAWYGPVKNNNKTNALLSNEKSPYLQCERAFEHREIAKSLLLLCYRNKNVFLRAQTFSIAWTGILYIFFSLFLSMFVVVAVVVGLFGVLWMPDAEYRSNVLHMYTSQMHKDSKARTHIFSTTMGKFVTSICCG